MSMIIPMLKAIHKMLEGAKPEKVECARDVLGELIEHLEVQGPKMVYPNSVVYKGDPELDMDAQEAEREFTG